MMTVTRSRTVDALGYAALAAYVVAVLLFSIGVATDADEVRDFGLAFGLLGLALDMRHHTGHAIHRMVYSMSLWQDDGGADPLHRRERPTLP
jgi:hypothetical protein